MSEISKKIDLDYWHFRIPTEEDSSLVMQTLINGFNSLGKYNKTSVLRAIQEGNNEEALNTLVLETFWEPQKSGMGAEFNEKDIIRLQKKIREATKNLKDEFSTRVLEFVRFEKEEEDDESDMTPWGSGWNKYLSLFDRDFIGDVSYLESLFFDKVKNLDTGRKELVLKNNVELTKEDEEAAKCVLKFREQKSTAIEDAEFEHSLRDEILEEQEVDEPKPLREDEVRLLKAIKSYFDREK